MMKKAKISFELVCLGIVFCFLTGLGLSGLMKDIALKKVNSVAFQDNLDLPAPGAMVKQTSDFAPAKLKGIKIFPDNPLKFDFVIDCGNTNLERKELEEESAKLIKYFLASLTVPEKELWVNLSPYEANRVIPEKLGQTEMGKDLLAQDYILKQLTASLMYPEDEIGQTFWDRVYAKANELYGTSKIAVNTFHKVWIVPDKAVVYQSGDTAFIIESHLKVMLESDYLALANAESVGAASQPPAEETNDISSEVMREVILPEIEKEINSGENFANLRQIYQSLILAAWFKRNLKENSLAKVYADENKVGGVQIKDKTIKKKIYDRYVEAYKRGVYNYIKKDYDIASKKFIKRKYFSGGFEGKMDDALRVEGKSQDETAVAVRDTQKGSLETVSVTLDPVRNLDRLREKLVEIAQDKRNDLPPDASEDQIMVHIIDSLKARQSREGELIREVTKKDGTIVVEIDDTIKDELLGRAIQKEVIDRPGGVKAVNFKDSNDVWRVVGFSSELTEDQLRDELEEVRLRRDKGMNWIQAFNAVRRKFHGGKGQIDQGRAQEYAVGRRDVLSASVSAAGGKENIVAFGKIVSALRNHIGKPGSTLYEDIKGRILKGGTPIRSGDNIGNQSSVATMGTFIDEHFSLPEEAIREIITNAYDSMRSEPNPESREVQVQINNGYMSVSDDGSGMSLDTILKKFYPPFEGEKSGAVLSQIRDIINDEEADKISRIREFIKSLVLSELSDTERNSIKDVQSRLGGLTSDGGQLIKTINSLITFTGRFGIGFESLLYFVKSEEDFIEIITSTGKEAHRIKFFWVNGELQTGVDVLDPQTTAKGTKVTLQSSRFNKDNARGVVNRYLSFNSNARINVSVDGQAAEFINREVFDPMNFTHVSGDAQVEAFYSKAENTTGRSTVRINVHGVTILTKEIEGYGLPSEVIFNFPAQIGLPISRNKIQVNELFIEKAKDMLQMIAPEPKLMSAFYPLIAILESSAKASERNVLAQAAADAAYSAWEDEFLVYLPNGEEHSKVKHENVVLVDPKLMRVLSLRGFRNSYFGIAELLKLTSGEYPKVGNKNVYIVDFVDETKMVTTSDAILINRKYAPQVDDEKALYNVLLKLNKEKDRFEYNYQEAAVQRQEDADATLDRRIDASDPIVIQALDSLPDERSKEHFLSIVNRSENDAKLVGYIMNPASFVSIYNRLKRFSLHDAFALNWSEFYSKIVWNDLSEDDDTLDFILENERIGKLQEYFLAQNRSEFTMELLNILIGKNFHPNRENISRQVLNDELDRLWELREFLNKKTVNLIMRATLLDADTYQEFRNRLVADRDTGGIKLDDLSQTEWEVLNKVDWNSFDSSSEIPFQLFLDGNLAAVRRIAEISARLNRAFMERRANISLATSMCNMLDEEIGRFISSGKYIDISELEMGYGNVFCLPYYFQFFYGDGWREKLNVYLELEMRGREIWSLEKIMASTIPIEQKMRLLEAVIESVSALESEVDSFLEFPFEFDGELLQEIENPALFIQFISGFPLFDEAFLNRKHLSDQQNESIPFGYQYLLRYEKEILRKIITVFHHVSNLPNDEYVRTQEDLKRYFKKGSVTGRIAPYVQYLLNAQDVKDVEGRELKVTPQRKFALVDLYDTYLENSSEQESHEETAGRNGDFTSVDQRVSRAAQRSSEKRDEERQKLLRNTFRAAAQQSVDDLVLIREAIQNVIDETPAGADAQKVSINVYRKRVALGEELTVIDIQDMIGMNAERLFNKLLMPFSSSKKDSKKFLGKQGQGFFTLLANSEYVMLKTVKDGRVCILKITPEKLNGQVVDFFVKEEQRDAFADESNGTHIQATVRADLPGLEAVRVSVAGQKYAALVDPERLAVEINGEQVNANSGRKLAVEETRYGDVEFYSISGESFMALGGPFVKPIDDDFMALVPPALRKVLLENGFAVNLPFQNIRRIQGGSDIANKEEIYENIEDPVARGTIKLVIAMFARGDIQSLGLFGHDYYNWAYNDQAAEDAHAIMDGSADIDVMRARYFSLDRSNQLAKLLLALPLDFLNDILGTPMSMAELFDNFIRNRSMFTAEIIEKLPQPIKDVFALIEEKERKEQTQQEVARNLGVPDELISRDFSLPNEQGDGMGAYWAFIEMSNQIANVALTSISRETPTETFGVFRDRLEYLQRNPTQAGYYAEANRMSTAHAQRGGIFYAWNLLEQGRFLDLFSQYMGRQITLNEFLNKAFEEMLDTLTHELIHILEESDEETHNEVFFERQKILVSVLIGEKERVTDILEEIISSSQYADNLGDVSVKNFLEHIAGQQGSHRVEFDRVVIPEPEAVDSLEMSPTPENSVVSSELINSQKESTGGINLDPSELDFQMQGAESTIKPSVNYHHIIQEIPINGFSPIIFQIAPTNLPLFLQNSGHIPHNRRTYL
ncbi:MAG: hypothetical protein GY858_05905 [Candidatus Omnitrophica bacterium]|nr:hypothetical protein [Candidatus Omnitrophota bacterium]